MRFIFKTDYTQDIRLAKHSGHVFWYSALLLVLLAAPWIVSEYWLAQVTFILIYSIVGLGKLGAPATLPKLRELVQTDTAVSSMAWSVAEEARDAIYAIETGTWPEEDAWQRNRVAGIRNGDDHPAGA